METEHASLTANRLHAFHQTRNLIHPRVVLDLEHEYNREVNIRAFRKSALRASFASDSK